MRSFRLLRSYRPSPFSPYSARYFNSRTPTTATSTTPKHSVGALAAQDEVQPSVFLSAPNPVVPWPQSPRRTVPSHIVPPPYAETGFMPLKYSFHQDTILIHDENSIGKMRNAARLARKILDFACSLAQAGVTTDEIDQQVHTAIIEHNAYPSPLNYATFPKSVCSSINEVICHGIPDTRPLEMGDVVSFDVSCFLDGVHGDNCATVIVGDEQEEIGVGNAEDLVDWRGVPYKQNWDDPELEARVIQSRRLVHATREALYAGIEVCRAGSCLSDVGNAIHQVADEYGYDTVRKYRGHGIAHVFHTAPYVKHFRNGDKLPLQKGMIFTIEPMLVAGNEACREWADDWTVVTVDGGLAAQFEHTILITNDGAEILTLPESEWE